MCIPGKNMLKPLLRKIKKFGIIGFDIETYDNNRKFLMCSFYFSEMEKYVFFNKEMTIDFILKNAEKFRDKLIYAHNLGFDFMGLFFSEKLLKDFEYIMRGSDFILIQSYIIDGKFSKHRPEEENHDIAKIQFYDTFNFCKFSLEKIGKIIDMPKLEKPPFLGNKPKNKAEWDEIIAYNINDSRVVKVFAEFLQSTFNGINTQMKSTIAATAMDNFKRNYLEKPYTTPKISELPYFYESLKGGRTETFKRGFTDKKINCYDVNSLYPFVMDKREYPDSNTQHYRSKIIKDNILDYEGITHIKMAYDENLLPYLPYRTPNKLIFPKGTLSGWYTNFEIRKALEHNYRILKIYNGFYYTKTCRFFGDFVKDMYKLRLKYKAEKSPLELPIKIIMNSLYGKFAQDIFNKWELVSYKELYYKEYLELAQNQIGNSEFFRRKKVFNASNKPNFIIPAISSYVTSYARDELYKLLDKIQDYIIQIDTDSLFTEKTLPTSDDLGALKLEYSFKEFYPVKPKFYAGITKDEKTICKIKGVPALEQDINIFREILLNPQKSYTKFMKFRESLLRGMIPNETVTINKKFDLEDNKRDWLGLKFNMKDFQESKPLVV